MNLEDEKRTKEKEKNKNKWKRAEGERREKRWGRVEDTFGGNCEKVQFLIVALGRTWEQDTVWAERGRRKD